jgi:hypothetical protein
VRLNTLLKCKVVDDLVVGINGLELKRAVLVNIHEVHSERQNLLEKTPKLKAKTDYLKFI